MEKDRIDIDSGFAIMTPEEVALYLRKSISWVYKNWRILGGRKLGGSLYFPSKEDLYECIFSQRQGMEIRLHPKREKVLGSLFQDKNGSKASRSKKKGENKKSGSTVHECEGDNPNRHGLFRFDQQTP
jgi:hypothetical protein